jgi:uncharacterized membrane protein
MKKRELAAAIGGLQGTVMLLIFVVLVGPGRIGASLDAITPMLNGLAFLVIAVCVVILIVLAPILLVRAIYRGLKRSFSPPPRRAQRQQYVARGEPYNPYLHPPYTRSR